MVHLAPIDCGWIARLCRVAFFLLMVQTFPVSSYGENHCLLLPLSPDLSTGLPQGWKPLTFKKIPRHTVYKVESGAGGFWIRAESNASASALIRELEFNPRAHPVLRWRWKVENVIQKGDEKKKEGDDYAARVYVNFRYDPTKASLWERTEYGVAYAIYGSYPPKAALSYIWANQLLQGRAVDSAYTSRAKMIAVESGAGKVARWVSEERNIHQDYVSLFGEEPPPAIGVAIMTDTDNTQEKAAAYYADISFCKG